jgi:predicted nucleic acid-binding protein
MKIFIDTNVFFGDWFVRNANIQYLFHFVNNDEHELLISRLVVQEVENIRRREIANGLGVAKKALSALDQLYGSVLMELPSEASFSPYNFSKF